jgi:CDP-glucose 4,6-dehydratase
MVIPDLSFWRGKRVLVTGHTGFKGAWLALWLQRLGAHVGGYALEPPTDPNLFEAACVGPGMESTTGDIRDTAALTRVGARFRPQVMFHLAAQPLVRRSYRDPVETYSTNVMGTVSVLEAARTWPDLRAVVVVTSDKCYENREWIWGYREDEAMGGVDPYSSSKGCAELVTAAYRRSFFAANRAGGPVGIASARAGNVIGGGDWAEARLVPDMYRAFSGGQGLVIRSPDSVRPWQHVFEPLRGYLLLAERLFKDPGRHAEGWNFGPSEVDAWTVEQVTRAAAALWGQDALWSVSRDPDAPHEATSLRLDFSKARIRLGWQPHWDLTAALRETMSWYRAFAQRQDMAAFSKAQLAAYLDSAERKQGLLAV